jgi:gas vesicle protein
MQKRNNYYITTLLVGLFIGTLTGILFSPTAGKKIRSLICYQVKNILQKLRMIFIDLYSTNYPKAENTAKVASQIVVDRTMKKARQLLAEVQTLANQLDAKSIKQ